jgi:hypothetical protein
VEDECRTPVAEHRSWAVGGLITASEADVPGACSALPPVRLARCTMSAGLKALEGTVLTSRWLPDPSLPDGRLANSHKEDLV